MSTCPVLATQQRNKIVETAFGEQGLKRDLGGLTFRDVCYEASARCGRSSKIILNSCRYIYVVVRLVHITDICVVLEKQNYTRRERASREISLLIAIIT